MQLYMLSVQELLEEVNSATGSLRVRAMQKLDPHRLEKVQKLGNSSAQNQAIGAGLLLQLAVQTREQERIRQIRNDSPGGAKMLDAMAGNMWIWSVSEILEAIHAPIQIAYRYDAHGKPDFVDTSWHFNLSHSGEYVCLATDEQPVGVDIQQMRPLKNFCLAEKYFSKAELVLLESCRNHIEKEKCFYRIWVKKEAYAKFTGEGIARTLSADTENLTGKVCWQEFESPQGYCLSACQAVRVTATQI